MKLRKKLLLSEDVLEENIILKPLINFQLKNWQSKQSRYLLKKVK